MVESLSFFAVQAEGSVAARDFAKIEDEAAAIDHPSQLSHRRARSAGKTSDGEGRFIKGHGGSGAYVFDLEQETVAVAGRVIPTNAKEFALALLLFRNLSKAMSRADILGAVWGSRPDLHERSLDVYISQIRTRLKLTPKHGLRLTSVYRFGYRLERLSDWDRTAPRGL